MPSAVLELDEQVTSSEYDLWYDPNSVDADLVVETSIPLGPRAGDAYFNPQPGDLVRAGDDEEPNIPGLVTHRLASRVWVRLQLDQLTT